MSKYKVLDIRDYIHLECIRINNEKGNNPYRLYLVYNARNSYGYYTQRKKQIAKYGNMSSVLCMVKDMFIYNVQFMPIDNIITWCEQYHK